MTTIQPVVFRCYENQDPQWEAYGVSQSAYGSGNTLAEARNDVKSALALLRDVSQDSIELEEFHERCVCAAADAYPDIWVRTRQDRNGNKMLTRRHIVDAVKNELITHPEYVHTFDNGYASTGDIIAVVALPDDMLSDVLNQIGTADRVYLCMPVGDNIQWQMVFTTEAEDKPMGATPIANLPLRDSATVADFMKATGAMTDRAANYLVAA